MAVKLGINITQNNQSIIDNKSNVTVSVYCTWDGWSYNIQEIIIGMPTATGWLEIEGERYDFRSTFNDNLTETGTKTIFTKTLDVYHDVAGRKTVSCSALYKTGVSSGDITADKSLRLTDIPRYATVEKVTGFNDESNPTITYANPAGSSVSTLQAGIKLEDGTVVAAFRNDISKTGTSYTYQLSEAERNALRKATPNSNTLKVLFCIRSTIGSTTEEKQLASTMNIVNANPALSPNVVDTNSKTIAVTGDSSILVALHSTARVTMNATAKKYASIVSKRIENGTTVLNDDGVLSVTNNPIKLTAVDSRGNTTVQNAANTIVPYINPTCSIGNKIPEADGSFDLEVTGLFYNGNIGKTANTLTVQYRVREGYSDYNDWVTIGTVTKEGNSYAAVASLSGLDYQTSYTFQIRAIDAINTDGVISAAKTVIAEPVFYWGKDNFQFNVPVNMKNGCDIMKNGSVAYAPDGYGLGRSAVSIASGDNLNNYKIGGWYQFTKGVVNAPFDYGMMLIIHGSDYNNQTFQYAFSRYPANNMAIRQLFDGSWGAWEWINPPMNAGVEYRTTERWQGVPVYTTMVNFGNMPNNSTASVSITNLKSTGILSCHGVTNKGDSIPYSWSGEYMTEVSATVNNIYLYTRVNVSDSIAYITLKYIK